MAITLIPEDQLVIIDDQSAEFPYTTDTEIHAVHWDGARGTVEYTTARAAEHITDISPWQSIIDEAKAALVKPEEPEPTVEDTTLAAILRLEAEVTPRRLREAALGNAAAIAFIEAVENMIAALRAKLPDPADSESD